MEFKHTPVLLEEAIQYLDVKKDHWYIDATAGGGGYTLEVLKHGGKVLAVDQDQDALEYLKEKFIIYNFQFPIKDRIILVHGNFSRIKEIVEANGVTEIDGMVFDLGFSSHQIENSGRGFSFRREEPLDMRMNVATSQTARDIVMSYSEEELYDLLVRGEEHNAQKIAHAIVTTRRDHPIETTKDLVEVVQSVVPGSGQIHPATIVFQALRMEVNQEIANLQQALTDGFEVLAPGARMVVVSFHSLEDRYVKTQFKKLQVTGRATALTKKPVTATEQELMRNKRARSAKLRAIIKI